MCLVRPLPGQIDDRCHPLSAAQELRVPAAHALSVLRIQLHEVGARVDRRADEHGDRQDTLGNGQDAVGASRARVHEHEAAEIGSGVGRDRHVLLACEAADLDERPRDQLAKPGGRIGRLHQRRSHEDGVRACQLGFGTLSARVDRALRDHDAVAGGVRDERQLRLAIDEEGGEVAGVDADRVCAECGGAVELRLVVRLDERVEADPLCVDHERRSPPVVEVAQDQKRRIGSGLLQLVELGLVREEPLRQEGQARGGARRPQVGDRTGEPLVDEDRDRRRTGALERSGELGGVGVEPEIASRGRATLHLGDRPQPGASERVAKPSHQRMPPQAVSKPAEAVSAPTHGRGVGPPPTPRTVSAKWCLVCADFVSISRQAVACTVVTFTHAPPRRV